MRGMPASPYHHIQRIDDDRAQSHAWRAQIQRRNRIVLKNFADKSYGGKKKALVAALAYRDLMLKKMHDPHHRLWLRSIKRRDNKSGIVGVGRYVYRKRVNGKLIRNISWQAVWWADDKRHVRRFCVSAHGERKAKQLAVAVHRKAMRALKTQLRQRSKK